MATTPEQAPGSTGGRSPSWLTADTVTRMGPGSARRSGAHGAPGRRSLGSIAVIVVSALTGVLLARPWAGRVATAPSPMAVGSTATAVVGVPASASPGPSGSSTVARTAESPTPAPSASATPVRRRGVVMVSSKPAGCTVRVDGRSRGKTPLTVANLSREEHRVAVDRAGYRRYEVVLDLEDGRTAEVSASLQRVAASPGPGTVAPPRPPAPIPAPRSVPEARRPANPPPQTMPRRIPAAPPVVIHPPAPARRPAAMPPRPPVSAAPPRPAPRPAPKAAPPSSRPAGSEDARKAEARKRYEAARRILLEEQKRKQWESSH